MARRWSAVLARLGTPTGDGRILTPGGITSRDLPLPLSWQEKSAEGHDGSVVVGRIETVEFHQDMITATGTMLEVPQAWQAETLIEAGVIGPSLDLADDVVYVVDENDRVVITSAAFGGATLVSIEAFADVSITLDPLPAPDVSRETLRDMPCDPATEDCSPITNYDPYSLTASVRTSGWSSMPIAEDTVAWDGDAAAGRVATWAGVDAADAPDSAWSKYARAFLRKDDDADPNTRGAYGYGIADVVDGTLTIIPKGVFAAAAAVQGARGASAGEDTAALKSVLSGIYERMDRTPPWAESVQSSANVSRETSLPPMEYFTKPTEVGPLRVDGDRVSGYIATWGTCHVGLPGCTTAPPSHTGYAHFLRQEQMTDDGTVIPVGVLSVGGGHADPSVGMRPALEHYDNVGSAVARVFAGEDEHGIWAAGWVPPYADPAKVQQLADLDVSGDWRRVGGNLELIAVCAVNTPGFPVLRKVHFSLGRGGQQTLIGQFKVDHVSRETLSDHETDARAAWARAQWKGRE